jgi:hypothetical protein
MRHQINPGRVLVHLKNVRQRSTRESPTAMFGVDNDIADVDASVGSDMICGAADELIVESKEL